MGVASKSSVYRWIFHEINNPAIGVPHVMGNIGSTIEHRTNTKVWIYHGFLVLRTYGNIMNQT